MPRAGVIPQVAVDVVDGLQPSRLESLLRRTNGSANDHGRGMEQATEGIQATTIPRKAAVEYSSRYASQDGGEVRAPNGGI